MDSHRDMDMDRQRVGRFCRRPKRRRLTHLCRLEQKALYYPLPTPPPPAYYNSHQNHTHNHTHNHNQLIPQMHHHTQYENDSQTPHFPYIAFPHSLQAPHASFPDPPAFIPFDSAQPNPSIFASAASSVPAAGASLLPTSGEPGKVHVCEACLRGFKRSSDLRRHKRTVHCKQELRCEPCDMTYTRFDTFRRHVKKKHPGMAVSTIGEMVPAASIAANDSAANAAAGSVANLFFC
ncbi:MAG: hypothetical protein SGCHY_004211 [Lobulomycetales sp.]